MWTQIISRRKVLFMSRLTHYYIYPKGTCIRNIRGEHETCKIVNYPVDFRRDVFVTEKSVITSDETQVPVAVEKVREEVKKYFADRADEYESYEYDIVVLDTVIADNWSLDRAKQELPASQFVELCAELGIQPIVAI